MPHLTQKIYFNANCSCRIGNAVPLITPKPWCAEVVGCPGNAAPARILPFGAPHTGWFRTLNASKRSRRARPSRCRCPEARTENYNRRAGADCGSFGVCAYIRNRDRSSGHGCPALIADVSCDLAEGLGRSRNRGRGQQKEWNNARTRTHLTLQIRGDPPPCFTRC
jgi:hypothetical protein